MNNEFIDVMWSALGYMLPIALVFVTLGLGISLIKLTLRYGGLSFPMSCDFKKPKLADVVECVPVEVEPLIVENVPIKCTASGCVICENCRMNNDVSRTHCRCCGEKLRRECHVHDKRP
jgi:hypothetical protein